MKKVGIMSMQRIANYGSFLQSYALKEIIESQENKVEFVDFHIDDIVNELETNEYKKYIRKISKVYEALKDSASIIQGFKFIYFKKNFLNKYLPLIGINNEKNYLPKLDCLVIGSDEVFNCIQNNSKVGYSLELFGNNNNAKKLISYAASFGNTNEKKLEKYGKKKEIGELLNQFDSISVRDCNSGKIINDITAKKPTYNLDPVLIYDFFSDSNFDRNISYKGPYILLYAYSGRVTKSESKWIANYAKKKKMRVYSIGGVHKCADEFISCTPFEIISYFLNATEIITDTFHGSIFSIITHSKFTTIIRKSKGISYGNEEKITDLLARLSLQSRMTENIEDVELINSEEINFKKTDEILKNERQRTQEYLRKEI